jgi:putative ABC transport system permease protein
VGQPVVPYASRLNCGFKVVSPSYFRAIGLRLIDGRILSADDREGAPLVVVINQTMARTFFTGSNPIGWQILFKRAPMQPVAAVPDEAWTIVGVIADEGISPYERTTQAAAYATRAQHPRRNLDLVIKTMVAATTLQDPIRRSIAAVDRDQAVADVKTIEQRETEDVAPDRLRSILLTAFATIASVLTALGIYGVIAFGVVQRTREIGIRAALGARSSNLLWLVLGQAAVTILFGLAIGLATALAASRVIATFLFGVVPSDPCTLAGVAGLLAVVAGAACYLPARQAVSIDPLVALKSE